MRSVGQPQMRWLGIQEGHHSLSHESPTRIRTRTTSLQKINAWFCGELAYLAKRLAETPEPTGDGSMLDHTLIVWTNELGKGNSHTLDNIPCVIVGGGPGFKMGRSLQLDKVPHNRLWLALAHAMATNCRPSAKPTSAHAARWISRSPSRRRASHPAHGFNAASETYARIFLITFPLTSVSRKSRPWKR